MRCALDTAPSLQRAGLLDTAARTFIFAADSALTAHEKKQDLSHLEVFLDCSRQLGAILRAEPQIYAALWDWASNIQENTKIAKQQLARAGDARRAALAYQAAKAWPGASADTTWELLSNVFHPRNLEAIRHLSAERSLRRFAEVRIDSRLAVTVSVTTTREDQASVRARPVPKTVFGYLPLYGAAHDRDSTQAQFVAGAAVYELGNGGRVKVRESGVPALRTDGADTFFYRESWGSKIIPYQLEVSLPPGFIPTAIMLLRTSGEDPVASIRFDRDGCVIRMSTPGKGARARPWLGEFFMVFSKDPELNTRVTDRMGNFGREMPVKLYNGLVHDITR